LTYWLRGGLAYGLLTGLAVVLADARVGRAEPLPWSWAGLGFGVGAGSAFGLHAGPAVGLIIGGALGLAYGLLVPRMGSRRADFPALHERVQKLPWSWPTPLWGVIFGVAAMQMLTLLTDDVDVWFFGLVVGLAAGLLVPRMSGRRTDDPTLGHCTGTSAAAERANPLPLYWYWPNLRFALVLGLLVAAAVLIYALVLTEEFALLGGLIGMLVLGLGVSLLAQRMRGRRATSLSHLSHVSLGLAVGLALARSPGLLLGISGVLLLGLVIGPLFLEVRGIWASESIHQDRPERPRTAIEPVEQIRLSSWQQLAGNILSAWLLVGPGFALGVAIVDQVLPGAGSGTGHEWLLGLISGSLLALHAGMANGVVKGITDKRTTPNEGIHRSARHGILIGLVSGLSGGLTFGLFAGLISRTIFGPATMMLLGTPGGSIPARTVELTGGLIAGGFLGLLLGIGGGLAFGGNACLRHLALRALLVRNGAAPWRYVGFLNDMADRRFLHQAGSGYLFIHGMLRDHFAGEPSVIAERLPWSAPPDDQDQEGGAL
jgi:hypothetical protein